MKANTELANTTVFLTGAGSGIGRALARVLASRGAHLACCGRRVERLDETVALIESEGGSALSVPADITDAAQAKRAVQIAREHFGAIDVAFNNAGRFEAFGPVQEIDADDWWLDVTVNLLGSFNVMQAVLPEMIAQGSGIIINMDGGRPVGGSGYACGKAGLMELTRVANDELRQMNSRVCIYGAGPGLVKTEMTQRQTENEAARRWIPSTSECFASGDLRAPEEIAQATLKLLHVAAPHNSGRHFDPDTDFSDF